jgi:hypothetical protein
VGVSAGGAAAAAGAGVAAATGADADAAGALAAAGAGSTKRDFVHSTVLQPASKADSAPAQTAPRRIGKARASTQKEDESGRIEHSILGMVADLAQSGSVPAKLAQGWPRRHSHRPARSIGLTSPKH